MHDHTQTRRWVGVIMCPSLRRLERKCVACAANQIGCLTFPGYSILDGRSIHRSFQVGPIGRLYQENAPSRYLSVGQCSSASSCGPTVQQQEGSTYRRGRQKGACVSRVKYRNGLARGVGGAASDVGALACSVGMCHESGPHRDDYVRITPVHLYDLNSCGRSNQTRNACTTPR